MRESAVRIVPPAMPNSSASATSARAGSTGGCEPSRTDSARERASSGSRPSIVGLIVEFVIDAGVTIFAHGDPKW